MSTVSVRRKPAKQISRSAVGRTFEEVCAQEIAAHDRYVLETAKAMCQPKTASKGLKAPKAAKAVRQSPK